MNKRIFVCTDKKFPRGDAGSNRILNICRALKLCGHETYVIGQGKPGDGEYDGIKYYNIQCSSNRLSRILRFVFGGRQMIKELKRNNFSKGDFCVLYMNSYFSSMTLLKYVYKKIGASVAFDVVEWHQPYQMGGKNNLMYKLYKKTFDKCYPMSKKVIPISKCLEEHFKALGCETCRIPIFIDPEEHIFTQRKNTEFINIVYAGKPYLKDDFECMFKGLLGLPGETRKKFRFYLAGMSMQDIVAAAGIDGQTLFDSLKDIIIHYDWLEHDKLVELYSNMDFLYVAKLENVVNVAGFPSKIPEAMASGIVPVMNRTGDIIDYLTDGVDSILYNNATSEECTDALLRISQMSDDEIALLKTNTRKTACEKFDYRLWGEQITGFFNT